ncbi:MAG: gamma-glutamyl hercynylcysteine S-oxide synthase [Chthoniobacter sp.]|nr:gamma-glutamyl hercynylcysteine S-oxide synthase [Chthoniobacter sp.]
MKILIVDSDTATIQTLLSFLKETPGNEVRAARDGDQALKTAEEWRGVDLLITEVFMEPMNGFTLRNKLENRYPAAKAIFISEYDLADYAEHVASEETVAKPVQAHEMFVAIAKTMAAAAPETPLLPLEEEVPATPVSPIEAEAAPVVATAAVEPLSPVPIGTALAVPPVTSATVPQPTVAQPAPAPETRPSSVVKEVSATSVPPVEAEAAPTVATAAVEPINPVPIAASPTISPVVSAKVPEPTVTQSAIAPASPTPAAAPETPLPPVVEEVPVTPVPPIKTEAAPVIAGTAVEPISPVPIAATPAISPSASAKAQQPKVAQPVAKPASPTPAAVPNIPTARAVPVAPKADTAPPTAAKPATTPVPVQADAPPKSDASLVGGVLGNYKIIRKLGDGKWGPVYEAEQTSMGRLVALKVLAPDLQKQPEAKSQFIGNASAKANVQHPFILSVYEAGETEGHCYFTHEYVEGDNLATYVAQGRNIDEPTALHAIKVVGEALHALNHEKVTHGSLEANSVYIGEDNRPRLANLATMHGEPPHTQEEIQTLGRSIAAVLPTKNGTSAGLQAMLRRMQTGGTNGFLSWTALLQAVKALEPKVNPADAFKLNAQDEAAIRAVEQARRRQKRSMIYSVVTAVVLVGVAGALVYRTYFRSNERTELENMVKIPAGDFVYQEGQAAGTGAFWISQYEVTIGQYAKFLDFLKKNPTAEFDHPKQPVGKSHVPKDDYTWGIYYEHARLNRPTKNTPIDMNCPIFNVDYWDAYAYAKWKGQRLPTEQEWEKAARGSDARLYPWGNDLDPKRLNGNADYVETPTPETKAESDGYWWWSPVDAKPGDKSPYGVIGMAGNVSEWTDTWLQDKYVVIRGGNFHSPEWKTTKRVTQAYPGTFSEYLGFRTVSDSPPK